MATRMKPERWHDRPRMNRLASVMYPELADDAAKTDMAYYARQEGKRSPLDRVGKAAKDVNWWNRR